MSEPFQLKDNSYFIIEPWHKKTPDIIAGFTTKKGGFSHDSYKSNNFGFHVGDDPSIVLKNRETFAKKIDFPLKHWICPEQIHGTTVQYAGENKAGSGAGEYTTSIPNTDGLFTDQTGLLLALAFADCVPIYFFAPLEGFIGLVHAGWKGTAQKAVHSLLDKWKKIDIPMNHVHACLGPSICKNCYRVDDRVIEEVNLLNLNDDQIYSRVDFNEYTLDLKRVNYFLIRHYGVPEKNIMITNFCTSCHNEYFFSHRRDRGKTGRMIGFIGIRGN